MSVNHLRAALASGDDATLLRYAKLHLGDGNEEAGRKQIDEAYIIAIKTLVDSPPTNYAFVRKTTTESDTPTLAHLFLYTHLELLRRHGDWIHDGEL
jgi:hypothetical protein